MESGAKYREQRKKEGGRPSERGGFLPPLSLSSHPLFFLVIFFFGPSPLLKRWYRLPPGLVSEDSPVAAKGNQNLMSRAEIIVLPYPKKEKKKCIHHACSEDVALPLSLQKFLLGICTLKKLRN